MKTPPAVLNARTICATLEDIQRNVLPNSAVGGFLLHCFWSVRKHRRLPIRERPGVLDSLRSAVWVCEDKLVLKQLENLLTRIEGQ